MDDDELWAPAPTRTAPPTVDLGLPGYTDLREVARGGDSVVYRARQAALHRDVAVKVLLETDPATVARFARELELTVRLGRQHPHIVTVLDTGTTAQGHPCLVMDFHDLGSLHDRLRAHGPLPVAEVVAAGTDVADALAFAHRQGVLHRDVKPQNVLLLPTSYVLTDFGIARMADAGHTASLERFSYRHASPQVLDGLEPVPADDVWSLGSTLHTLLDGRVPFASPDPGDDTALGYLRRVRTGERRPLDRADVPDGLRAILDRCLAPAREDRYPSADDVHAALVALPTETRSWTPGPAAAAPSTGEPGPPAAVPPGTDTPVPVLTPDVPAPDRTAAGALRGVELPPVQPEDDHVLAPSALSLLAPPPVVPDDDEATGLHPEAAGTARPAGEPDVDRGGPAGWVRVAGFVGGALLVGSAVGLGVTLWASSQRQATTATGPSAPPTAAIVPSQDATAAGASAPAPDLAATSDPAIAPTDVVAVDQGTSLDVSWSDPTGGAVQFVVVDPYAVPGPRALAQLAAGVTGYTVEGVDPQAAAMCVQVLAIAVDDVEHRGVSPEACVQR
ncbi:protein kinase domain-containing protein [Cellulomonas sp. URHB0016]